LDGNGCLVVVDGSDTGQIITDSDTGAGIDITDAATLTLIEPGVHELDKPEVGSVLAYGGAMYIYAKMEATNLDALACVQSPDPAMVGKIIRKLPGRAIGVARIGVAIKH
jgi:hypothetical protein